MTRTRRGPQEIAALREKIAALFNRNMSYPHISETLGISPDCLNSNLRYLGLRRRKKKDNPPSNYFAEIREANEMLAAVLSEDFFEHEGINRARKILGERLTEQVIGDQIIFYLDGRRANLIKISEAAGMIKRR